MYIFVKSYLINKIHFLTTFTLDRFVNCSAIITEEFLKYTWLRITCSYYLSCSEVVLSYITQYLENKKKL